MTFLVKYDYRNMTTALQGDSKEPDVVWLQHRVYVNLGKVGAAETGADSQPHGMVFTSAWRKPEASASK